MDFSMFKSVKRSGYLEVSLDDLTHNVNVLKGRLQSPDTGLIAVVKAGAYGHGSVHISRHLKSIGVERLAVATIDEGVHLREHGITGPLHLLGNVQSWEVESCIENAFIPTVCSEETILELAQFQNNSCGDINFNKTDINSIPQCAVNIKIDTGMSRNGCQPEEFRKLFKLCEDNEIHVDAVFTHFVDSWGNKEFTKKQYDTYMETVEPVRSKNLKLHVANTGAILNDIGTDLDFVRSGIGIYGLPPDTASDRFKSFGLKPIAQIKGIPTLVKKLENGRKVGYSMTYETEADEWIATFPVGYADGLWRHLSSNGQQATGFIVQDRTGRKCPIVGRVSMDAITVKLLEKPKADDIFTLMTNNYDRETSASGIAEKLGTIAYEVGTRLSCRYARVYMRNGHKPIIIKGLDSAVY